MKNKKITSESKNQYLLGDYFDQWALKNRSRFRGHFPILLTRKDRASQYRFQGIAKQVILVIGETGNFSVIAKYKNEWFDFLLDLDFHSAKNSRGYYCSACRQRRYYPGVEELMLNHCTKSLISWINDNLKQDNYLVFKDSNGSNYVEISKYWSNSVPIISRK